jgi:hypothetical protein
MNGIFPALRGHAPCHSRRGHSAIVATDGVAFEKSSLKQKKLRINLAPESFGQYWACTHKNRGSQPLFLYTPDTA